jgi:hypothetical protein
MEQLPFARARAAIVAHWLAAVLLFLPGRLVAQQAEFSVPEEIEIVSGRLAVTFVDGVAEAEAVRWLREEGYEPEVVHFQPVSALVVSSEPFAEEVLTALRARAGVVEVTTWPDPLDRLSDVSSGPAPFYLRIRFDPATSEDAIRALVEEVTGLAPAEIHRIPNDIEIRVPEGEEALALEALQGHPWVRYVTYVAVPGDGP